MVVGSAPSPGTSPPRLGLRNVYGNHPERYPHVSLEDLRDRQPDLIVLPDEPYRSPPPTARRCSPAGGSRWSRAAA